MAALVRIHAGHRVHVPECITSTPQSVPAEYAAGLGGHEAGGCSLSVSAEHLLWPGDQQRGSHKGGWVSKHSGGTRPSTQEKRETGVGSTQEWGGGHFTLVFSIISVRLNRSITDHFFSG